MAMAAEHTPDLILLDVMMPGMDGFEVCRSLRADPLLAEVPVVMVTALDDRDSRLQGIEAGADDFVSKPFDRVELRARVRTIARLNRYRQLLVVNRQLESKIDRLSALYSISSALNSTIDIDELLGSIIQKVKELLSAIAASVLLWDQQKNELYFHVIAAEEEIENLKKPEISIIPVSERIGNFKEVELGFTEAEAIAEAKRCLRCDLEEKEG